MCAPQLSAAANGRILLEHVSDDLVKARAEWRRVLLRRSQRPKLSWERFNAILKVYPISTGRVRDWRHQMA
jgi:hypothetical protein